MGSNLGLDNLLGSKKYFLRPNNLSRPEIEHVRPRDSKIPSKVWGTIVGYWSIVNSEFFSQEK